MIDNLLGKDKLLDSLLSKLDTTKCLNIKEQDVFELGHISLEPEKNRKVFFILKNDNLFCLSIKLMMRNVCADKYIELKSINYFNGSLTALFMLVNSLDLNEVVNDLIKEDEVNV